MATANAQNLIAAEIRLPRIGAWHADIDTDGEDVLTSPVRIEIDGVEFVGAVVRTGNNGSRVRTRVVGGAGGLSTELPAKSYSSATGVEVRTLVGDLLREAGETLSATSDQALLSRRLPRWHREHAVASHSLVRILDAVQASWRVLRDGTVWVGPATYPEATVAHVLIDEDWASGHSTIAPERPELEPGVTFRGQKIELVVHRVDREGALRTEAWVTSANSVLERFLARIRQSIDYTALWPCRVVTRNADGTLQLVPDDERMKGSGLDKVPMRGAPEFVAKAGDRVRFGFEGGDPSRPFAAEPNFEGERAVARVGDPVVVYVQPGVPVPFTGTINGLAATGTFVIATPVYGSIMSGQDRLRA
jgi:hypothetical protein